MQNRKREKSPSELGKEVVAQMLREDALEARQSAAPERAEVQPLANTRPEGNAVQPVANARPGEHTYQSTRQSDLFTSPQRMFAEMTDHTYVAPAWQPPAAVQGSTAVAADRGSQSMPDWQPSETAITQNLNGTAPNGSFSGGPAYTSRLSDELQQSWEPKDPSRPAIDSAQLVSGSTQPAREELLLAAAPDLAAAGIDMNTVRAGLWLGDKVNRIAKDSYLAPDTSPLAFIGENILSGARSAAENGWNGFMNYALPFANATLDQQIGENEQLALIFGGDFRQHADLQNAQLQEVRDGLPEAVETLRLHDAAAYQQSILDRYDPHGAYIPIGEGSSILGQGFFQMLLGAINPALARGQQFFSASDSTVQQGRDNGASDELALLSGAFSGGKELLNNKFFGGIPFLGDSFADDLAMRLASTNQGRAILKTLFNIGGESLEEVIGTFEDALILNSVTDDDRGFWQTIKETAPEAIHVGLISLGPSSILSSFSFIPEYRDARIVDEALDIMNNGGMLTDVKLAEAKAAMHRLMGDGHNSWNGVPSDEWTDTLNKHLDGQLSPAAHSAGNAADLSGIDTSNLIMFPMLNDTNAQTNAAADSNAIPFPTANGAAAALNGQQDSADLIMLPMFDNPNAIQGNQTDSSNLILFPTGEKLTALVNAEADSDGISSLAASNAATVQNGQIDLSNIIHFPAGTELAALVNPAANPDAVSSLTANGAATAQNSPLDLFNEISSLVGNKIAADQNHGKTTGDNLQHINPLYNAEIEKQLLAQEIERGIDTQEHEIEVQEAEADERDGWIEQRSEALSKEEKSGMLSIEEIRALGKALVRVSHPSDSFLLNSDQKITLRKAYRQILTYAKNLARNTEVDMLFRMDMTLIGDGMIVGEPGAGSVTYKVPNEDFISVHNHSDGRTFSEDDIRNIIICDHQRIVIAVGHNGKVYVLEKHPDFRGTRAALAYKFYRDFIAQHPNRAQNAETYIATMEELIKGVEKYGIFYFSS